MAARGTIAKEKVEKKIAECFGEDFIGLYDRKCYVWANDGGERVQIAISMTCPKTPIEIDTSINTGGDWDWGDSDKKVNNVLSFWATFSDNLGKIKVDTGERG